MNKHVGDTITDIVDACVSVVTDKDFDSKNVFFSKRQGNNTFLIFF